MALTDLRFEHVERDLVQIKRRLERLETHEIAILGGSGGAAPADAQYVVMAVSTLLTAERAAAATAPIVLTDGGAGGNATWSHGNSGVVAGVYGNATNVAQVTVSAMGHVTAAANVAISGSGTGVAGQVAYWDTGTTIAGDAGLTYDAATDSLTLLSATSTRPRITLENTNGDAQAQVIEFYKNSGTPGDADDLGAIDFYGETSTGAQERYAYILSESLDVTNGDTGGGIKFVVAMDASERNLLEIAGYNGSVNEGEIILNEDAQDVDIRMESTGVSNMFEIDSGSDTILSGATAATYGTTEHHMVLDHTFTPDQSVNRLIRANVRGDPAAVTNPPDYQCLFFYGETVSTNALNIASLQASTGQLFHRGSGTLALLLGYNADMRLRNTGGNITNVYMFNASFINEHAASDVTGSVYGLRTAVTANAGGNIGTVYGYYYDDVTVGGGSACTTQYGIYLENVASATTNWAIYSAGGNSYHAGSWKVGDDTTADRLLHVQEDDAVTAAITYVSRRSHTTSGAAAALFGVGCEDELEDAGGTHQVGSEQVTLWATATAGSESPLRRWTTYPAGSAGPGYCGFWTWNDLDGTARTAIPNGTGDVAGYLTATYSLTESGGGTAGGTVTCAASASVELYNDGTDVFTLAVAADGSVTVQRTAGASTADVGLWMVWT